MPKISQISALEILDSRGDWTIETNLILDDKFSGSSSVPAGASVGSYEMKTIPAKTAVAAINGLLGPRIMTEEFSDQAKLDEFLISFDSSSDRSSLGANTILSISLAFCKAQALEAGLPIYKFINKLYGQGIKKNLPQPLFNIVNGGRHAENDLDFQEFLIVPRGEGSFSSSLEMGTQIFHHLSEALQANGFSTELGDEGGYAPQNISYEGVLNFILQSSLQNNIIPGKNLYFGIDLAASTLALGDLYNLNRAGLKLDAHEMEDLCLGLCSRFPIIYLEDPFGQNNFSQFKSLKDKLKGKVEVVGDDLVTTNVSRLQKAIDESAISGVIIKPNQIGTLTETLSTMRLAKKNGIKVIVSHRSGETDDSFIADLAVGMGADYIKAGAPARGERVAKYNRLLEIESELRK